MADMEDSKDSKAVSSSKEEGTEQEQEIKITNDGSVHTEKGVERGSEAIDEVEQDNKEIHDEGDSEKGKMADEKDPNEGKVTDEKNPNKGKAADGEDSDKEKVVDEEDPDKGKVVDKEDSDKGKVVDEEESSKDKVFDNEERGEEEVDENKEEAGTTETQEEITKEYTDTQASAFLFNVDTQDEYEVQETVKSLLPSGTYTVPMKYSYQAVTLSVDENNDPVRNSETIQMDYTKLTAHFVTLNLTIEANKIRFVKLFKRTSAHTIQYEINLSLALDNYTTLHLLGETLRDTVDIGNGFRRLVYDSFKILTATDKEAKSLMDYMTPKYSGDVSVFISKLEETSQLSNEIPPQKYHCVLDKECLGFFKSNLDTLPVLRLCFWHETHEDSVDKVMLFHEKELLRIQSLSKRFDVMDISKSYADLLRALRQVKPLPKETFEGQKGILKHHRIEEEKRRFSETRFNVGYPSTSRRPRPPMEPQEAFATGLEDNKMAAASNALQSFYAELNSAEQEYQAAEELSLQWIVAEEEIKSILDQGFVPETDVLSGGLNPDNIDHFFKCVEEIENQLKQQNYQLALSRLQGMKKIFSESQISEMSLVLNTEDITLLRKMYYHSFA